MKARGGPTRNLNGQRFEQFIHFAFAVGKRVEVNPDFVEEGQVKIGQRGGGGVFDVTPTLHAASSATGDEDREVGVVMDIGIADAAAVEVERMVEQAAI